MVIAGVILNVSQAVYQWIREIRPAGIGAEGELAKLGVDISASSGHPQCAALCTKGAAVTGFQALGHNDIDDAADAFRIVLDGRIGNDLNLLDGRGRNCLDKLVEVPGQHPRRPSVHEDLVIRGAVQQYLILSVDAKHWHVSENIDEIAAFRLRVCLHVIGEFVGIVFYQLLPGDYRGFFEILNGAQGIRLGSFRFLRPGGEAYDQCCSSKDDCLCIHCFSLSLSKTKLSGKSFTRYGIMQKYQPVCG